MTRTEHLLTIAIEECAELQKELCKRLRFGPGDRDPNDPEETSVEKKMLREAVDVLAMIELLQEAGIMPSWATIRLGDDLGAKKNKVERFLNYSQERGTVTASPRELQTAAEDRIRDGG